MGSNITVSIPVTWIPYDLTTKATKQSLLNSPEFRRMMTKGLLAVVTEDYAQSIMQSEEAQAENRRIYDMTAEMSMDATQTNPELANMKAAESGAVSGFAMNLAHADTMEESRVLNTIKSNENTLSMTDMKYIAENSKHARVKSYMADRLLAVPAAA